MSRATRRAALIDAVLTTVVLALRLLLGWNSRDEVMTVLLVTGGILIVMAGLGASGTSVMIDSRSTVGTREAPLLVPTAGPFTSTRTMGLSALLVLAAVPFIVAGLVLYASP